MDVESEESFKKIEKQIKMVSDDKINETFSVGALKLSPELIAAVSFTFWLVYMAETDLNNIISRAWSGAKSFFPYEVQIRAKEMLTEAIGGDKRKVDPDSLEYFSDKIKMCGVLAGDSPYIKLLWKLNGLRNDLSHNRLDKLAYNGLALTTRDGKEAVILDYFRSNLSGPDPSESEFWKTLTDEDKDKITELLTKVRNSEQPL